jgi:hypothetical protein
LVVIVFTLIVIVFTLVVIVFTLVVIVFKSFRSCYGFTQVLASLVAPSKISK